MHLIRTLLAAASALGIAAACSSSAPAPIPPATAALAPAQRSVTIPSPAPDAEKPADLEGLHNVVAYGEGLYSGSEPDEGGLETLAGMGIRTIVSVDGAQPEVEAAAALGMRYVHLPIGYDGIDEARKLELARAVRDLPGPVYVHCHHGKHRSAGAASAIGVTLGRFTNDYALARMKVSGTAPNYAGLYACATETKPATAAQISAASDEFPSQWKTSGLVQSMVEVDHAFDGLKAIEKAAWKAPADHPDLVPAAEVGRIAHILRALNDDGDAKAEGAEFLELLDAGTKAADALEKGFLDGLAADELAGRMKKLTQSCKACHAKYRD